MVALGVDMQAQALRGDAVLKPPPATALACDECPVTQEALLSTTTVASSHVASISSAGEEEDADMNDGSSEDADDEDSDDDVMRIGTDDELVLEPATPQHKVDVRAEDRLSDLSEVGVNDMVPSPKMLAPVRFSLVAIPGRVRASVFGRKPRRLPAPDKVLEETPTAQEMMAQELESPERESTVDTVSPASTHAGRTLPSLTSFTSISKPFSGRTADQRKAEKGEKFKSFWDDKLHLAMDRIAHRSNAEAGAAVYEQEPSQLDVFHLLLKLYAHQDVIAELYESYVSNAADFEFYIPQLCTFFLHGNYAKQHQLECFLMSRSGESLVFAHRLGWFLKSFCADGRGYKSEYLSVTSSPEEENADLLIAIQQRGGVPAVLMEQGLNIEEVNEPGPNLMLRRASAFDIDAAAIETSTKTHQPEDDAAFAEFLQRKRNLLIHEAMPEEGNEQQLALYNATPNFITELTDLADRLIPVPLANRNTELRRQLADISEKSLPSNVIYLPVGNSYHRVKGLKIDECFTFSTKERVPYFLCVEVVDYSVQAVAEETEKKKTPVLTRQKTKKFDLKLRFKKNREALAIAVTGRKSDLTPSSYAALEGIALAQTPVLPRELLYEDESKTNDEVTDFRPSIPADVMDVNVLALTPCHPPTNAEVAAALEIEAEHDGDDEKEKTQDSTDSEQKKHLGQWGLPRVRRRSKASRSNAPKTSRKFDSFYSSWFAKKSKAPEVENQAESPVSRGRGLTECAMVTPLMADSSDSPTPTDIAGGEDADPPPVESELFESEHEPVPEPKLEFKVKGPQVVDSSEDEIPKSRVRDISVSLDFTDSDAWRLNFDLEDALTDVEPEVTANGATPEMTPEVDHDGAGNTRDEEDVEDCEGEDDGEDFDDEKPIIVFRERWSEKEDRIRKESPLGSHPGWRLLPVIVKSNDDLRQEQFAAQLIAQCDRIFKGYSLPLRLRPYNVIASSAKAGLIEAVPNTVSLDSLRRNDPSYTTLLDFFKRLFGTDTPEFRRARRNFVESLSAYSILCYVLQIKDRHNGNILLDTEGHVIHIDFGFLLTNSPGSNLNFEKAPFKLTDEFVELMGGPRSATFRYFRSLCIRAYLALRRNMDKIVLLVEMMLVGNEDLPCFAGGKRAVIEGLKERLKPGARTSECQLFVNQLIDRSTNNWRTRWYDKYQRAWVGIL